MTDYFEESMICPNCGHKLVGFKNSKGECKIHCERCGANIFSKEKTPNKKIIEISS